QQRRGWGPGAVEDRGAPRQVKKRGSMDRRSFIATSMAAATGLFLDWSDAWAQVPKGTPGATVSTTAGKVRGLLIDKKVHAFRGVPYGASTAGCRRCLPPVT